MGIVHYLFVHVELKFETNKIIVMPSFQINYIPIRIMC